MMPSAAGIAGWCLLHAALAAGGTVLARKYALRRRMLDEPGERRSHQVATPRGGGIAIVISVLLALAWLGWSMPEQRDLIAAIALGLLLVAGVGWRDDHRPLSAWWRLLAHALAAVLVGWAAWRQGVPALFALTGAAAILVLINFWNFMDGIDALAASQAALAALTLALLAGAPLAFWLALALASACVGFLPFNLPRARIFLGDVGSGALGYLLGVVWLMSASGTGSRWLLLSLPFSAFVIDAGLTLVARMVAGERWWSAHTDHLYQRMARREGHGRVSACYAAWTLAAMALAWALRQSSPAVMMCAATIWHLIGAGAWYVFTYKDRRNAMQRIDS